MLVNATRIGAIAGAAVLAGALSAQAGPWPQREGGGLFIASAGYLQADNSLANANPALGNGTFSRLDLSLYGEYGLTDNITLGAATQVESVRLHGSITKGESAGLTDVDVFVRPVLWSDGESILSAQGTITIPTGYSRDHNPALGDGAVGLEPRLLFGQGITIGDWPSFIEVEAAYRFRLGAPADQVRLDGSLGVHVADDWMLLLQSRNTISMRNQSGLALSGSLGTDYDLYTISLSVVHDLSPDWSIEFGATSEVGGRNYNTGNGVFLSVWRKF